MEYKTVICGGTFDRLHGGHKYFLRSIFSLGNRVLIGLTSDSYIDQYKRGNILPFQERLEELKTFLANEGLLIRAEVFPIQDIYGKATDSSLGLDAMMVTESTKKGGEEINKKRKELGLSELPLIIIPMVKIDDASILSSTKIREGTVGRHGEIYMNEKWTTHTLVLPEDLREILHKPFHTLLTGPIPAEIVSNAEHIATVGDATTKRFNHEDLEQGLSIVDFSVERKALFHSTRDIGFGGDEEILPVTNPSGHITPAVWNVLRQALVMTEEKKRVVVQVDGEEDLFVIPLILMLPLGWKLFYGQPNEGIVYVPITEEVKEKVYKFLIQFVPE